MKPLYIQIGSPVNLDFTMLFILLLGCFWKMKLPFMAQRKPGSHCWTSPVAIPRQQWNKWNKWRFYPANEKEPHESRWRRRWGRRVIETHGLIQQKMLHMLACWCGFPLTTGDLGRFKHNIISPKSESNKTCLLTLWCYHSPEEYYLETCLFLFGLLVKHRDVEERELDERLATWS